MKSSFTPYIYIGFFLWNISLAQCQEIILEISAKDSLQAIFLNGLEFQKKHPSETSLLQSLDSLKNKIEGQGFFNYQMKDLSQTDSLYRVEFNLGELHDRMRITYDPLQLGPGQLSAWALTLADDYFEIETKNLPGVLSGIVQFFEAQGYSFAEVSLSNISLEKDLIRASLEIQKKETRKIDKVVVQGYTDFPESFVTHFAGLKNKAVFSQAKLDRASRLIQTLPFVSELKAPEILFTNDSTLVYLYLKKKKASKFDGLVGFSSKEIGKGLTFNGYLDLSLINVFNGGEAFSLNWKSNGENRQVFKLAAHIPFIFNSNFSTRAGLSIYKQDSTFVNTKGKLTLPYLLDERNEIAASVQAESSSDLLTTSSNTEIQEFQNFFLGLSYNYKIAGADPFLPLKLNLFAEFLNGHRKIGSSKTNQTLLYFKGNYLFDLNYKNHILVQNESGTLFSENTIFNELFRIGGVNSIRGFNEESIFASTYTYFNVEYRLSTNSSSYLYSITDFGYVENDVLREASNIYALGLGYAFSTNFGLLNLSYAIGGLSGQDLNFDNSRFHLKIISFF